MTQGKSQAVIKIVKVGEDHKGVEQYTWFIWLGNSVRIRTMKKYHDVAAARRTARRWTERLGLIVKDVTFNDLSGV